MTDWQPIETAPRDGTEIEVEIPGHGFGLVAWLPGLLDEDEEVCGGWHWMEDLRAPPEDWDDGICWASNSDGVPSTQPVRWKPYADKS